MWGRGSNPPLDQLSGEGFQSLNLCLFFEYFPRMDNCSCRQIYGKDKSKQTVALDHIKIGQHLGGKSKTKTFATEIIWGRSKNFLSNVVNLPSI